MKVLLIIVIMKLKWQLKMKAVFQILTFLLLILIYCCADNKSEDKVTIIEKEHSISIDSALNQKVTLSRIQYVTYGYYCGECDGDCTRMYRHYLTGNVTTFWTDKTDSYFSDEGLKFDTKMTRESEKIGLELISKIPESILNTTTTVNNYGCPDCDDGCGLYFEFQFDKLYSKPIIFEMEYGLNNTTAEIKEFGILIIRTIEKLEKYRW